VIDSVTKKQIDDMSYKSMLELWRRSPLGHYMFQGEIGEYYSKVMNRKRNEVGAEAHTLASKEIGFDA
jgi:hypothetical protein